MIALSVVQAMRTFWQDVRFGLRVLLNSPGFTAVAVFTLALGIAANTIVFSWIDGVLLHSLPGAANSSELAVVEAVLPDGEINTTSVVEYRHFRDSLTQVSGLATASMSAFNVGDDERGQRIWGELVSSNYFDVLGVKPIAGRVFEHGDFGDQPASHPYVVISERFWQSQFRRNPAVIGETIRLNRRRLTIIGVVPAAFGGLVSGLSFDLWAPVTMAVELGAQNKVAFTYRETRGFNTIARLKSGATLEQARQELVAAARRLDAISPDTAQGISATMSPVWKANYGAAELLNRPLQILMAVAGVVLLIVCANLANLLLARSVVRQKEFAIRLALGAGPRRVAGQLLTETLLLALFGAAAALPCIMWLQEALVWLIPRTGLPVNVTTGLNVRILIFTTGLCLLATLLSGVSPALFALRSDVNESLKAGGRAGSSGVRSHRLRGLLVVSEVALATVALIGAGLFVRSFQNARTIHPGFDPNNVLVSRFYPSSAGYSEDHVKDFCLGLRDRLKSAPGILNVTYTDSIPLGFEGTPYNEVIVEGYAPAPSENMKVHRSLIAPGYFELMRIPLVSGRDFSDHDNRTGPDVMIVNESFARRFYGASSPLGHRVRVGNRWFRIVGTVKDSKYRKPAEKPIPFFYLPFEQMFGVGLSTNVYVRTAGDPNLALPMIRRAVAGVDPALSTFHAVPLTEASSGSLYPHKIAASLLTVLGVLALMLSAVGLYSVMAYAVSQRTQELGIRIALGAQPYGVLSLVLRQALVLTLAGVGTGLFLAMIVARLLDGMLINVSAFDPATFAAAAVFLGVVGCVASYLPARRATKVDPITALRCQ